MSDPILAAHLDALEGDFNRVQQSVKLARDLLRRLKVPDELPKRVNNAVEMELRQCRKDLHGIRQRLDEGSEEEMRKAWAEFAGLQQTGRVLFGGCLEFLGGLAFRDDRVDLSDTDDKVWDVADALIADSASDCFASGRPFVTVPAAEEALCDSVASTIRVRFPEWTIWSLPLTAYEFGHVALIEEPLDQHFKDLLAELSAADAVDRIVRPRAWRFSPTSPEHRVRVLLADAFAACHLGLAYGAAAIHLRFDPSAAYAGVPSFDARARTVIAALRSLADERYVDADALTASIDLLEGQWEDAVQRAGPPKEASTEPGPPLSELLEAITAGTQRSMLEAMVYGQQRWELARRIYLEWETALREGGALKLDPPDEARIADVLNAAWLSRLKTSDAGLSPAERNRQINIAALEMALRCLEAEPESPRRAGAMSPPTAGRAG